MKASAQQPLRAMSGVDVALSDIAGKAAGGITEMLRIAALASAREFRLAPHAWSSAFLVAASLQLAAALPNYSIFEFTQTYNPLLNDLITTPIDVGPDGCIPIPQGPGLGVEIVAHAERRFPFQDIVERKPMV